MYDGKMEFQVIVKSQRQQHQTNITNLLFFLSFWRVLKNSFLFVLFLPVLNEYKIDGFLSEFKC